MQRINFLRIIDLLGSDCSGRYSWQTAPMRARAVSHVDLHIGKSKMRLENARARSLISACAGCNSNSACALRSLPRRLAHRWVTSRILAFWTAHAHCAVSHLEQRMRSLASRTEHARSLAPRTSNSASESLSLATRTVHANCAAHAQDSTSNSACAR